MWKSVRAIFSLNDPGWGRSGGGDQQRPPQRPGGQGDGPPDLDELWRDFNRRLNGLFGKKGGGGPGAPRGGGGGGEGPSMKGAGAGLGLLAAVAVLLWLGSGFYIVQEGQASAVLRFGEFKQLVDRAGFTWRMPYPIESHEIVNTQQLRTVEVGYRNAVRNKTLRESLILTLDQSIVDLQFTVQYRIGNARDYLFNNDLGPVPEEIVRQAAETAMREIVGRKGIDQVLYEEKEQVALDAREQIQLILDRYKVGISVVDVTIQQAQPPEQVQAAFEDANKAAQDRENLINEGQAYANDVIPRARGTAARLLEEAEGYRARVVAAAEGDASRFNAVLVEYAKAPQVTRERMYIETMQQIFANTSKVLVDTKSSGNLLYLPLDRLMQQGAPASGGQAAAPGAPAPQPGGAAPAQQPATRLDGLRSRERDTR
ncbi:FtsH protease activity modulator HflK [Burkholderiaceae bacterium FT117]|uniref:FtsH protease activity modulator HflK n=1 Tax=Zeimonas sediminis TaxID=2944268 RepID=UPI002342FCE6|nr:FtsH protease activity modulator HflK [Zeimonas sediminis]MCM5571927.1 FtsH protease activity modulator HflK [Zeimonas sediminis]